LVPKAIGIGVWNSLVDAHSVSISLYSKRKGKIAQTRLGSFTWTTTFIFIEILLLEKIRQLVCRSGKRSFIMGLLACITIYFLHFRSLGPVIMA